MTASRLKTALVATAAITVATTAQAADTRDARIEALERQIQALSAEVQSLKTEQVQTQAQTQPLAAQVQDLKRSTAQQYADVQAQRAADPKVTLNNGRPTFATADGRFSASLRALVQYDAAYYAQDARTSAAPDLSSGTNFRRARFGVEGTVFTDWTYSFLYDAGSGSGQESGGLSDAYVQYNGFAPVRLRFGSFATPAGLEDQTGTADLIFPERAAPTDLARSIAASDGRQNYVSVFANDDDYYAALSLSGDRFGSSSATTNVSDEQLALVGRLAYRIYKSADTNILLSANGTYLLEVPDSGPVPAASNLRLRVIPESAVDSNATRLVDTGNVNADSYFQWGLEAGAQWKNLYAQGGYFGYEIDRVGALPDPDFSGWYVQGTWVLTGENRRYAAATASWGAPQPRQPFSLKEGGLGAWEVAARYSVVDLDYNAGALGVAAPAGGIRGGEQRAWTVGLNWYPNNNVRFLLDYQHVDVDRLAATAPFGEIGTSVDIGTLRTQIAF